MEPPHGNKRFTLLHANSSFQVDKAFFDRSATKTNDPRTTRPPSPPVLRSTTPAPPAGEGGHAQEKGALRGEGGHAHDSSFAVDKAYFDKLICSMSTPPNSLIDQLQPEKYEEFNLLFDDEHPESIADDLESMLRDKLTKMKGEKDPFFLLKVWPGLPKSWPSVVRVGRKSFLGELRERGSDSGGGGRSVCDFPLRLQTLKKVARVFDHCSFGVLFSTM